MIADDRDVLDPGIVGFKFARQAELLAKGFPIPRFRCISGSVFNTVINQIVAEHADSPVGLRTDEEILAWARRMYERIAEDSVPAELMEQLREHFDDIAGDSGLVAVRACAVRAPDGHGEDSETDPFAGLSESFLYVGLPELPSRIAACWASAYLDRAVLYRIRRGIDPLSTCIAVGIQRMVPAERSFVVFTRDPIDGSNHCVIAAAYGCGEGVVQEKADLDHFYIDPVHKTVRSRLAHKTTRVGARQDSRTGPEVLPVPTELADVPVLTDSEAIEIAALAARIEDHFRLPQDIEGAIADDRRVMIVQARPAAIAAPQPAKTPAERPADVAHSNLAGEHLIWGNSNLTEGFPGVSCVLTYSVAAIYGEQSFTDFYRRMGVPASVLATRRHDLQRLLAYLRGRMYYRLNTWYSLHSQIPSFPALRDIWERSMGLSAQAAEIVGERKPAGRIGKITHYAALAIRLRRHRAQVRRFLEWWDGYYSLMRGEQQAGRTTASLVEDYHLLWAEVGVRWGIPSVNNYYLLLIGRFTDFLVKRWTRNAQPGVLTGMLCADRENRSVSAIRSAVELAELAGHSPEFSAALQKQDDRVIWEDLTAGKYGEHIVAAARQHVQQYGDRSLQDLKMESVTIFQEPWQLVKLIRAYRSDSLTVGSNRAREQDVRDRAERELRTLCRNPVKRTILHLCYYIMRDLLGYREDMRFCRSQLFGICRSIFFELGDKLVESGILEQNSDVLDLTAQEVIGAFDGTAPSANLAEVAQMRHLQRKIWAGEPDLPPQFTTDKDMPIASALTNQKSRQPAPFSLGARHLKGIASSPGHVVARAKVILDPAIDPSECNDRILIARETDPGWLFLMMAAKGIIVERGSPVSHTAITGRMLAIPTVVAVAGATTLISDGDWVELDGTAGTVALIASPQEDSGVGSGDGAG